MPGRLCATICATLLFLSTVVLAQEKPEAPKPKTQALVTRNTAYAAVTPLQAQEKPDAPKPKHDRKVFIVGTALLAASKTADAITTRQLLDRGGWENDPILGRHPSNAQLVGVAASQFAAQALAFHFTERSRRPWLRWLGRAYIGFTIEEHTRLAVCNAGINMRGPVQNCRQ